MSENETATAKELPVEYFLIADILVSAVIGELRSKPYEDVAGMIRMLATLKPAKTESKIIVEK